MDEIKIGGGAATGSMGDEQIKRPPTCLRGVTEAGEKGRRGSTKSEGRQRGREGKRDARRRVIGHGDFRLHTDGKGAWRGLKN